MKKLIPCFMFCACTLLANPISVSAGEEQLHRIGVATIFEDAGWQTQIRYLNELIGPALHMEFVCSDKLSTTTELTDFMTQSISLGCDGIINFLTQNEIAADGARLAEENGVWYVTQNSMVNEEVADLEHNLGHVGASVSGMEAAYKQLVTEMIQEEGRKGFFIYTGSAVGGNRGEGASSHYHSVKGMLEAIAEAYDLNYEESVEDLINRKESGLVETGRDDVHIYLSSSGSVVQGSTEAAQQLATGAFDTLIAVTSYTSFTTVVSVAERSKGENIMIAATVSDDEMTKAGFETMDKFGDSVLHAAVVNPLSIANARCALLIANAFDAEDGQAKGDGYVMKYEIEPKICYDNDEYEEMARSMTGEIENLLSSR